MARAIPFAEDFCFDVVGFGRSARGYFPGGFRRSFSFRSGVRRPWLRRRVRPSVLVRVACVLPRKKEVDVRIMNGVCLGRARSDLEKERFPTASILDMMAVGAPGGKARAFARTQDLLPDVGDEDDFALEDPDELVFGLVPVPLARPGARRETEKIHAELAKTGGVAKTPTHAIAAGDVVGCGIARSPRYGCLGDADFRHGMSIQRVAGGDDTQIIRWMESVDHASRTEPTRDREGLGTLVPERSLSRSPSAPMWRPQRDSNPCCGLERAVSWASRRWGRGRSAPL